MNDADNNIIDEIDDNGEILMRRRIEEYRQEFHRQNRRRIRAGIRCLLLVPLAFLIMLLMTGSDRIIFLCLWVISMFLIAAYLIYAEYMDFKVDKTVAHITGQSFEKMHAMTTADARDISARSDKESRKKKDKNKDADGLNKTDGEKADEEHSQDS